MPINNMREDNNLQLEAFLPNRLSVHTKLDNEIPQNSRNE